MICHCWLMDNVHVTDHNRMCRSMFISLTMNMIMTLASPVKLDNASVKWFMKEAQSRLSIDVDGNCSKSKQTFDSILCSLYKSEAIWCANSFTFGLTSPATAHVPYGFLGEYLHTSRIQKIKSTGLARLIRSHSSARISFKKVEIWINRAF